MDVSGVWTFIDNSSVTNQSGSQQLSTSTKLLQQQQQQQHSIPMNSMGGTSMLAMLQMSNPNLDRPVAMAACPKKKPRPMMGLAPAAAASYHHQRSKSQDPDAFLQQQRPLHQRSRSQDPDTLVQTYGSQQHIMQQSQMSHPSLMLHSTPVQQQKQKVLKACKISPEKLCFIGNYCSALDSRK